MNFIKTISEIMGNGDIMLAISVKKDDVSLTIHSSSMNELNVDPVQISGKIDEMEDEKLFDLLKEPMEVTNGIVNNLEKVKQSAKKAEKETVEKTTKSKKEEPKTKKEQESIVKEEPKEDSEEEIEEPEEEKEKAEEKPISNDDDDIWT